MPYTITGQTQQNRMQRSGAVKTVYLVDIETDEGATGTLEVAEKDFVKETLADLLAAFEEKLDLPYTVAREARGES